MGVIHLKVEQTVAAGCKNPARSLRETCRDPAENKMFKKFFRVGGRGNPNGTLAAQSSSCNSECSLMEVGSAASCRAAYYGCNDRRAVKCCMCAMVTSVCRNTAAAAATLSLFSCNKIKPAESSNASAA